jgi:hypothetical protein
MIKQIVTAASFALGGAGVVLVGYLSSNPRAFTQPVVELASTAPMARTLADNPVAVNVGNVLVLPEITLAASPRRAPKPAAAATLDPCTDYRDIGAVFIDPGGATGVRQVRHLCMNDAN